jgi:transcription elongation factor Elf1
MEQVETEITCPFCGEHISILVDPSVDQETYIEDCSVCCRPIEISVTCASGEIQSIEAQRS